MSVTVSLPFVGGPLDQQYVKVDADAAEWRVSTDRWTSIGHLLTTRYLRHVYAIDRHERRHFFAPDWMPEEEAASRFWEFIKYTL